MIRKNFAFTKTWSYNTKLHDSNKKKWDSHVLSRLDFWMVWRCHGIPCVYFYFFCLEPTLGKDTWMRATSTTVMVIFSKVLFWKLLDHNHLQSSFSIITRHIGNIILIDTLQLKILQTRTKIPANSFIKTWIKIVKRKSRKMARESSLVKKTTPSKMVAPK